MTQWWRDGGSDGERRGKGTRRRLGFDLMEGRVLLSALGAHPARAGRGAALQAARLVAVRSGVRDGGDPATTTPPAPTTPQPGHSSLGDQVEFAVKTYADGRSMAASPAVQKVGVSYAKLSLAHDTRKVGVAYLRAALKGDGKTLNHLGDTRLVRKVGHDFT